MVGERLNYQGQFIIVDGVLIWEDNMVETLGVEDALLDYDFAKFYNITDKKEWEDKLKKLKGES